jgi:hypothetical protein
MDHARDFTRRLQDLLRREHGALADFLVALAEFDARRLWVELGHASLFYFLHRELALSKGAAFYRKTAAELIQRFPEVVEPLRHGRLCLTTIVELAKVITPENRAEVLPRFFQLSKQEAKEVSAEISPVAAPLRDVVTVARAPELSLAASRAPDLGQSVHPANQPPADDVPAALARPRAPAPTETAPETVEPLTCELSRMHVTVTRRLVKKLEQARAALSHSHPGASLAEVIESGLDLLLDRHAKRNGLVKKPRSQPRPSSDPDRIPAHVRRAVWRRDGGRCQWPVASGGVCGSTVRAELHHRTARARGGPPTVENLLTVCDVHHDLATRREFGDALVDEITRRRRGRAAGAPRSSASTAAALAQPPT